MNKERVFFGLNVFLSVLRSLGYFFITVLILGGTLSLGIGLGYFAFLVSDTEVPDKETMVKAINDIELVSSFTYDNGEKIADFKSDLVRTRVNSEQISPIVEQALIATEDEYFNVHKGIVPKALLRAVISDITGIGGQSGGSTLTQQLVKQQILTDETTFSRKANEILLALRLEKMLSKEEILTAYLNVSPFGRNNKGQNIAGIQEAARGLFGKNADDLSLPQAAFIAGLPQSPIVYSPYTNLGQIKPDEGLTYGLERKNQVLYSMYREKFIDKAQYEEALNYDLKQDFLPQEIITDQTNNYLYYQVENDTIETLMTKLYEKDNVSEADIKKDDKLYDKYYQLAERELRRGGYVVQTTINKNIYEAMNNTAQNSGYILDDGSGNTVQLGSVLMENQSGKIIGFVAGRNYEESQNNHAFNSRRSPGSTMKPIVAYAPAIDTGMIGSESQLSNHARNYPGGGKLTNYGGQSGNEFKSVSKALAVSDNIPVVNLYEKLIERTNVYDYFQKMNSTINPDNFSHLSLPLGTGEVTVDEQTNYYQTLANNGVYQKGYMIHKIVAPNEEVIYEHQDAGIPVFKPATATIMQDLMRHVLNDNNGTGRPAKGALYGLDNNLANADWVGKTGTSELERDYWFIASTPGVTLTTWIGKEDGHSSMDYRWGNNNMQMWAMIANAAYQQQPDLFKVNQRFELDNSVIKSEVSDLTGTKMGNITINGRNINVPGKKVQSYFAQNGAANPDFRFGIGGTDANYQQFWNAHLQPKKTPPKPKKEIKPTSREPEKDDEKESDSKDDED